MSGTGDEGRTQDGGAHRAAGAPRPRYAVLAGVFTYDVAAGAAAMYLSVVLRYLLEPGRTPPGGVEWIAALLFAVCCAGVFIGMGLPRALWRHTGFPEAARVVQAAVAAHLVFLPVFFLATRLADFPRSSLIISGPLMVILMLAPRIAATAWRSGDLRALFRMEDRTLPPAVLVGPVSRLADVIREQTRRASGPSLRVKALIDTEGEYAGRALLGAPVAGGLEALERAVERVKAQEGAQVRIVLAEPEPPRALIARCAKVAGRTGSALSRARTGDGPSSFTQVEAADLLSRPPRALSRTGARTLVAGRRVMVTGAGGAIGSELVRQCARLKPERLILFEQSEANLYQIDHQLAAMSDAPAHRSALGDVRDRPRLEAVMAEERPDVILHAAALKHVPLMEDNGCEAVLTNVFGTRNVIEAANATGVRLMALISTDKAVDPANVMGASKRAAELLMAAAAPEYPELRLCAVRFGNVLASTGSVVPLFERQIAAGGPVTVTHPDTTRYFMTVEEAAGLVLEAGAQTLEDPREDGALYLLDMGEPVPIARLARQLIRLRGKEPQRDVKVLYTGLRPGEKLHETLTHAFEITEATPSDGVLRVQGPRPALDRLDPALQRLNAAACARDEEAVRAALDTVVALGWPEGVVAAAGRLSASG